MCPDFNKPCTGPNPEQTGEDGYALVRTDVTSQLLYGMCVVDNGVLRGVATVERNNINFYNLDINSSEKLIFSKTLSLSGETKFESGKCLVVGDGLTSSLLQI
jgi:hypothetical protein